MSVNTARNAELRELFNMLTEQAARRVDLVVPATAITAWKGNLHVKGADPVLDADGVTLADGIYRPNTVAVEGFADKTGIPVKYLRGLHENRTDLFDANVNGWLRGGIDKDHVVAEPDGRSFLLRTYKPENSSQPGIARALLSDKFKAFDNLDALASVLEGLKASGIRIDVRGADLTERRMRVRVVAPEIAALAPVLLKGYRSPYSGQSGTDNPVVFAGLEISNSEVGNGAFTITPRLEVQICTNGMRITKDAVRNVHLGGKLEQGIIRWSAATQEKNLELVKAQTIDAVGTFLDVSYMEQVIAAAEEKAGVPVSTEKQVRDITKATAVTQDQIEDIMSYFVNGGQANLGGLSNAITAFAQKVDDGDVAADLEDSAMAILA